MKQYIEKSSNTETPLTREGISITSKLSPYEQGSEMAPHAIDGIIERLGFDYVDLLLIHWPGTSKLDVSSPINARKRRETWRSMERAVLDGKCKAIGVSNFEIRHLEELLEYAEILPSVNQVEVHPLWPQAELRAYCAARGISVVGYSPFGGGALLNPHPAPEIIKAAITTGKTPSQVLCCWGLQKGLQAVIPKSVHRDRIAEFSPRAPGMQPDEITGRYLPESVELELDRLGAENPQKFCWDPAKVS